MASTTKARTLLCERLYDSWWKIDLEGIIPGESRYLIGYEYEWKGVAYHGEFVSPLPYSIDEAFTLQIDETSPDVSWLPKEQQTSGSVALKWLLGALAGGVAIYLAIRFDLND